MDLKCTLFTFNGSHKIEAEKKVELVVDHLEEAFARLSHYYEKGYPYCDIFAYLHGDWHYLGWFYLNPLLSNG